MFKKFSPFFVLLFFSVIIMSCGDKGRDYTKQVDVFIGTQDDGNTFPGVSVPFGGVQLSPDTKLDPKAHKAYSYSDSLIYGFSHTHLNGVGEPEYKDILFMPFIVRNLPDVPDNNFYAASFSHDNEHAGPGYYSVKLNNGIDVQLTATERCGFHKYTYPASRQGVFIDLTYPDGAEELYIKKVSDYEIEGLRRSHGWAYKQYVYFIARFSKPIESLLTSVDGKKFVKKDFTDGKSVKAMVIFDNADDEELLVKVGISAVSTDGARKNLEKEITNWDFDSVKKSAHEKWNKVLSKIDVEGGTKDEQTIFYTAMYHAYLSPDIYQDIDGRYRGIDGKVHTAKGFTNYTVFSIWDTYRALHPLFTITDRKLTNQFIRSLIAKYDDGGRLPMWPLAGNYTDDMLGYHVASVIADAYVKGIRDYDAEKAFQGMKELANMNRLGLKYYKQLGYIPYDRQGESVSKTLEYCYDDWCIAQMAKSMNKQGDYDYFHHRAHFYENVFDPTSKLFRGRSIDRKWLTPFYPLKNSAYSEGNAYQYIYVPHDIDGLIRLMGGDDMFAAMMDVIFTKTSGKHDGSIGQYWHGNEPSHHLAYLFTYAGEAWKTQYYVNRILHELYSTDPDGIAGNDDCGQISAWYILSSLGFYPVAPGQDIFVIGTPLFNKAVINLEDGKKFTVIAKNRNESNYYIQSATLNGRPYNKSYIKYSDIMAGGVLAFEMGPEPNKQWASKKEDRPYSQNGKEVVRLPFVKSGNQLFKNSTEVGLGCDTQGADIHFTLDGTAPGKNSKRYTEPINITKTTDIKIIAYKDGMEQSLPVIFRFEKAKYCPAVSPGKVSRGLEYEYFERFFVTTADLDKETPLKTGVIDKFSIENAGKGNYFGYVFEGFIMVPKDDIYTFYVKSNDGSRLYIDGIELIENDGNHGSVEEVGRIALKKGYHRIKLKYMQCGGGKSLKVSWQREGGKKQEINPEVLFH